MIAQIILILATGFPSSLDPTKAVASPILISPKHLEQLVSFGAPMAAPKPQVFPATGFWITNASVINGTVNLGWQRGIQPFQVWGAPTPTGPWGKIGNNLVPRTKTFPVGQNSFWRVQCTITNSLTANPTNQPRLHWTIPDTDMSDPLQNFTAQISTDGGSTWANITNNADSQGAGIFLPTTDHADEATVGALLKYRLIETTTHGVSIPYDIPSISTSAIAGRVLSAARIGGPGPDFAVVIKIDRDGNYIVCGYFTGTTDFGGHGSPSEILTSAVNGIGQSAWAAKYTPSGTLLWVKGFTQLGAANSMCIDSTGAIIIAGNSNLGAIFKLSPGDGSTIWIKGSTNGAGFSALNKYTDTASVSVDSQDGIWIAGSFVAQFTDGLDFGNGHILFSNSGGLDAFLAHYDSSGSCTFAQTYNGSTGDEDHGTWVGVDKSHLNSPNDIVYLAGWTYGGVKLDGVNYTTPIAARGTSAFLGAFDTSGNFLRGKTIALNPTTDLSGGAHLNANSGTIDSNGDVILGGDLTFNVTLGGPTRAARFGGIWFAKYRGSDLAWQWDNVCYVEKSNTFQSGNIGVDSNNNVIMCGFWAGDMTLNSTVLHSIPDSSAYDWVVVKCNSTGTVIWVKQFGGTLNDSARGIAFNSSDEIIVVGGMDANANGTFPSFGSFTPPGFGGLDILILRLAP